MPTGGSGKAARRGGDGDTVLAKPDTCFRDGFAYPLEDEEHLSVDRLALTSAKRPATAQLEVQLHSEAESPRKEHRQRHVVCERVLHGRRVLHPWATLAQPPRTHRYEHGPDEVNQLRIVVETLHAKNGDPIPALVADSEDDREAALL